MTTLCICGITSDHLVYMRPAQHVQSPDIPTTQVSVLYGMFGIMFIQHVLYALLVQCDCCIGIDCLHRSALGLRELHCAAVVVSTGSVGFPHAVGYS